MSSTQHQLIEQCATRLRGIVEALDNIHDNTPHRWSTDLDDVHSSAESLLALINDQAPPSEDQLIAAGLSYPLAKEDAVKLWYSGFRSEVITVLEAWEAIGHDTGINPDKEELLESLRNMAAICNAHGNDMPAQSVIDQHQVIADAITGALAFGAQASQPPAEDHWLRPFYDIGRAEGQRTLELAMLVRMLASSLKRHAPESNLVARATNYLAAKGLVGTPLRDAPASVEQAGRDVEPAPCPFCGGEVDPTGWLRGDGTRGPECNDCGATARSMEAWQTRAAPTGQTPQAWLDVQAERLRQVEDEGWTPEHDDEHADGQMAQAAGCYALHAGGIGTDWPDGRQNGSALFWPWDKDSWKPTTPRRDLVKACALALAEIERLDRAGISQSPQPGATTASS
ncbi:hypothetical protein [Pseudomonas aeruginosa]|uniref:hypothetical protein n=1 Tax=Pseudomonas aeruginosa TaxID=287 RepID=UPI0006882258|nr:hypothetical protein [Pseudomonas aeruginosa]